jgi:polyisoprenoid-binding protein YceI
MLNSIDAGSDEANDEVKSKSWFNVKQYPSATFVSSAVKTLGGNRYQAVGKFTIKGKVRDVVVPFTAVPAGESLLLDGSIPISRAAFGIGEGAWADPSVVADDVQVKFHFVLSSAK